ncbi:MAG: hypothetical protein PHW79_10515 [Candidatus Marinimicrobia bacterium]|nr:hypothetical protein [Candidatus Neomarinimicrobiota bacterium]
MLKAPRKAGFLTILRSLLTLYTIFSLEYLSAGEYIVVHRKVGATIDLEERIHFNLFTDMPTFRSAQFFQSEADSVTGVFELFSEKGNQTFTRQFSPMEIYLLASKIDRQDSLSISNRQYIQTRYQPLFTNEFIKKIPERSLCQIRSRDKSVIEGAYYRTTGNFIQIWQDKKVVTIPTSQILKIKYWDDVYDSRAVYWGTVACFVILGVASSEVGCRWLTIQPEDRWIYDLAGSSVGAAIGHTVSPFVNELFLPKTVINFNLNKIKRLDTLHRLAYNFHKLKGKLW